MKRAIGYIFFAIMLIVTWGIRLGLPIFGIYYIVKTFIDDGVIAGLISIPVAMIGIGIIEFVLDFAMLPFATLVYFLLDEDRPSKPSKDWFQRHLNWTVVMLWVLVLPLAITLGNILGVSMDAISLLVPIVIILPLTGWLLKQKNRSLWWLLLFIIPFVWLVYLGLGNRSSREQGTRTLREQRVEAIGTESQEEEYKHNVWEIYRKECELASPEKKTELNKRMLHWQELMKNGCTASQAYIRVMGEESDTPARLIPTEKKPKTKARWYTITKTTRYLLIITAFLLLLSLALVIYNQISTPTPEPSLEPAPTPETTGVAPIQTATGDLVIEVDKNGLSINKNRFTIDSTLDDYIKVLGNPSRVTELMNTIHTYDDAGIRLYQPPDTNKVISVGTDFTNLNYQFSPKHTFRGVLTVGHLSVGSGLHADSLKAIPNLIVEDTGFGVYTGTLGSIILNFDYRESKQRLDSLAISFSESSKESTTSTIGQGEQEVEEGWVRLIIKDVGSIDYPTDFLELSSGVYRDTGIEFFKVLEIEQSYFTLQQVGLNELKPSALKEYRRVVFRTDILDPGEEVFKANEKYTASPQELAEFKNMLIDQLLQGFAEMETKGVNNKIIDPGSIEIVEVSGMFPLLHTYRRQLNDNPIVLVKTYLFWNYDKIHPLAFSCRVMDEEECKDVYEKMLYSFRLQ